MGVARGDASNAGATGLDLRPVLEGGAVPDQRALLWHQPHYWGVSGPGIEPFSALRLGRWKLLYFHSSLVTIDGAETRRALPRFELFDLSQDIGETQDLAAERPAIVAALAEQLSVQLEATGAAMSVGGATNQPVPLPRAVLSAAR